MLLQDKVVIVSGIGPGLGIELALLAAQEARSSRSARARPPSWTRRSATWPRWAWAPSAEGAHRHCDREQCRNLVERTVERFGRVDSLINSAYVGGSFGPIETADLDDWRATWTSTSSAP